ncbi:MAG: hypothetical protein HFG26_06220 [Provencibacterium sp.]|jgi:hypothetical protein|nr:hypothetical protein [Provencibacterium sp.]
MDYFYYTAVYGGKLLEKETFERLKGRAQRYVSALVRPAGREDESDAERFAVCAVAEALHEKEQRQEKGSLKSETVGRYSVQYEQTGAAAGVYAAAARWLEPAGLLYRGV